MFIERGAYSLTGLGTEVPHAVGSRGLGKLKQFADIVYRF